MQELTYEDANERGIDTSMIKTCKRLRQLAKLDRVKDNLSLEYEL